jgi:hypothetical protein
MFFFNRARSKNMRHMRHPPMADYSARCCQTNDFKHQIDGAIEIYALNN